MEMEYTHTTNLQALWTPVVMQRVVQNSKELNEELYNVATQYDLEVRDNRKGTPDSKSNNLGYGGVDLLTAKQSYKSIKDLTKIVDTACRDFLEFIYGYKHTGDLHMNAGTFWQQKTNNQNIGIQLHTHPKSDLVAVYYPKISGASNSVMTNGGLRLYDPSNIGKRFWECNNHSSYYGGWFNITPEEGMLVVFEGWIPHDSGYFDGDERLSIPFLINVDTELKHKMVSSLNILEGYDE